MRLFYERLPLGSCFFHNENPRLVRGFRRDFADEWN